MHIPIKKTMLQSEFDKKVNELSKVHLKELQELQTENVSEKK